MDLEIDELSSLGTPRRPQKIMNQYAVVNEPLDVLMGGPNALLQIVHTLVGSLSRLDESVETLFSRLNDLEGSVETLTFNIQGFESQSHAKPRRKSHLSADGMSAGIGGAGSPYTPVHSPPAARHFSATFEEKEETKQEAPPPAEEPAATETEPIEVASPKPDWKLLQGEERENAAASKLQTIFRGHRERSLESMMKRIKVIDMSFKKIPKTLTVSSRLERVEEKCEHFEAENRKLLREMHQVREDAKEAVKKAEEKSEKALKGVVRLDHSFVELKDAVDEALLEQGQRTDALDSALNAFQDEVASGFESQGQTVDGLKKELSYIQSPEGQAALKDGLIEMEMGGVLASVLELKNIVVAASPLPRQDSEVVQKLANCQSMCNKVLENAQKVEEEEMAELLAAAQDGDAPSQDAWLGALNEPEFMNLLVELLWAVHVTLKEDAHQTQMLDDKQGEGKGGSKVAASEEPFTLGGIKVYVESLTDVLGDVGASICNVLEHFLNKGRQQIAIRELWGSLSSIKSDVLRDVSVAVQGEMDKKADQSEFVSLMKRSDAGLRDTIKMKPEVELWSLNKEKLLGLDIQHFTELEGRVDESFTTVFTLQASVKGKVGAEDLEQVLGSVQAQFGELEERHAAGTEDFERMLQPKVDRTELAKLARALASKGGNDDPVLAFYTEKPQFSCLSCNRPLPRIPNSVESESAPRRAAPEVFEGGRPGSPGPHSGNVLVPQYEKPLAKVRPPPKQRSLHPSEEHRYALDLAKTPEAGIGGGDSRGGGGGDGVPGSAVSRYERNIPSKPSRMNASAGGGVNLN